MPESRLAKTRRSLPEGYQFGNAKYTRIGNVEPMAYIADRTKGSNRAYRVSIRERILADWNVIEGEHFASDADHHPVQEGERVE